MSKFGEVISKGFKRSNDFQRPPIDDTVDISESLKAMDDLDNEVATLENVVKQEPLAAALAASEELRTFPLSRLAKKILDQAVDNVSNNTGSGLEDPDARAKAQAMASLVKASGNSLTDAVMYYSEALEEDPIGIAGGVYSLCFTVMKACVFIGNLQYRRSLDPRGDYDLERYVDYREEEREPPYGLGRDRPDELEHGLDAWTQIEIALDDIRHYLQLVSESFGWDPERPMPFINVTEDEGVTFTPIHNVVAALDLTQVRSVASRAKRNARQASAMLAAASAARRALLGK